VLRLQLTRVPSLMLCRKPQVDDPEALAVCVA
jgi:hypothetical protein